MTENNNSPTENGRAVPYLRSALIRASHKLLSLNNKIQELGINAIVSVPDAVAKEEPLLSRAYWDGIENGIVQDPGGNAAVGKLEDHIVERRVSLEGLRSVDLVLPRQPFLHERSIPHIARRDDDNHSVRLDVRLGKDTNPDFAFL